MSKSKKSKLRVCIIAPALFPIPAVMGGAVEQLIETIMKENEKYKMLDLTICSVYNDKAKRISKKYRNTNIKYFHVPNITWLNKQNYILFLVRCFIMLLYKHFNIVVLENGDYNCFSRFIHFFKRSLFIGHIHNIDYINKKIFGDCKNIICISEAVEKKVLNENPRLNTKVVYNGIDIEEFSVISSKKYDKARLGVSFDEKVILFVGRLIKEKGVLELITAFQRIDSAKKYRLVIIGSSNFKYGTIADCEKKIFKRAKKSGNKILFLGHVDHSKLKYYYSLADLVVIPSMWEEAFGLVAVEAMASGKAIITTDSGALPEIIGDECGIIINRKKDMINTLKTQMEFILENDDLRLRMGEAAKIRAQEFSSKKYYMKFVQALKDCQKCN